MRDKLLRFQAMADRWTRDEDGNVVLGQKPNLPIWVGAVALILAWPFTGRWQHLASLVSFGAFFTWAWLEIFQGVNVFRRALGVLGMLVLLVLALH